MSELSGIYVTYSSGFRVLTGDVMMASKVILTKDELYMLVSRERMVEVSC